MTPHHVNDTPWPLLATCATVDPRGLDLVLARIVHQALADWRTGYRHQGTPDAAIFLRSAGLLTEEGLIDSHGHLMKGPQGRPRTTQESPGSPGQGE